MSVDLAVLHNELERLADIAQHEIDASAGSVGPFPPEARASYQAITARLVQAGVDPVLAEWATSCWVVGGRPCGASVLDCLAMAERLASAGLIHPRNDETPPPPAPTEGKAGRRGCRRPAP